VSRSAAFAFYLGDRFFGVITAHVPGPNAKHYRFTSALPTQVVKALAPALTPLLRSPPERLMPGNGQIMANATPPAPADMASAEDEGAARLGKRD
jgi:hypothetical protein